MPQKDNPGPGIVLVNILCHNVQVFHQRAVPVPGRKIPVLCRPGRGLPVPEVIIPDHADPVLAEEGGEIRIAVHKFHHAV